MQQRFQRIWWYVRITLLTFLGACALMMGYGYLRGARNPCDFSDPLFWGGVLAILAGGFVAIVGGRGQKTRPRSSRQRPLRDREKEEEENRQRRYEEREEAITLGIAIAFAAIPMVLIAWQICPY
jgi:hypothetical protein